MPINRNINDLPKIATREGYGSTLVELGKQDETIVVLDADLAAATKTGVFGKVFPDRHFNCGIAEGNMAGIAAGLAASGNMEGLKDMAKEQLSQEDKDELQKMYEKYKGQIPIP